MRRSTLLAILIIMFSSMVAADIYEENFTASKNLVSTDTAQLRITSLRYDPYPVNPGEYFTLYIKAENIGVENTPNATFTLMPKYPFSLDSNEDPVREIGFLKYGEPVVLEYNVRIDRDAVEGTNKIDLRYSTDGEKTSKEKTFRITVDDAQTDFDLVVQEMSSTESTIAIANTGKNIAYSVIVRIPMQEDFAAIGVSGQMVGNLENGDYTLVSFEINRKSRDSDKLDVQIDYTDEIGVRRSIVKTIYYNPPPTGFNTTMSNGFSQNFTARTGFNGQRAFQQSQTKSIYPQWWFWAIIVLVIYAAFKAYGYARKQREEKEIRIQKKR